MWRRKSGSIRREADLKEGGSKGNEGCMIHKTYR